MDEKAGEEEKAGISKVRLAIGAASLFLFIVGLKRNYRADAEPPIPREDRQPRGEAPAE